VKGRWGKVELWTCLERLVNTQYAQHPKKLKKFAEGCMAFVSMDDPKDEQGT
jgi:hypothetical protein